MSKYKILVGGAGGAPSNGFIKSLISFDKKFCLIGMNYIKYDLLLSKTREKHLICRSTDKNYKDYLLKLIGKCKPHLLHVQNDSEVLAVSRLRKKIIQENVKLYLPSHNSVKICINKHKSNLLWSSNGVPVPKSLKIDEPKDLKKAFRILGEKIWIRSNTGAAGNGSLPTSDYKFAKNWIDYFKGWGKFMASELLSPDSVTWQSIWYNGQLVVAQPRKRLYWNFSNRSISGVTGITGVGQTFTDSKIDKIAMDAIFSIDKSPHGIWSVDMTLGYDNKPYVTEINIGRFFTTHLFFTKAGLNMPLIYSEIILKNKFPSLKKKISPLKNDLLWIRGMDDEPILSSVDEISKLNKIKK